jgi:hypothetical protein
VTNEILYITLSQANYLQIILIAVPLTALNEPFPIMKFLISTSAIFIAFGGIVLIMFIPKVAAVHMVESTDSKVVISATIKQRDTSISEVKKSNPSSEFRSSRSANYINSSSDSTINPIQGSEISAGDEIH